MALGYKQLTQAEYDQIPLGVFTALAMSSKEDMEQTHILGCLRVPNATDYVAELREYIRNYVDHPECLVTVVYEDVPAQAPLAAKLAALVTLDFVVIRDGTVQPNVVLVRPNKAGDKAYFAHGSEIFEHLIASYKARGGVRAKIEMGRAGGMRDALIGRFDNVTTAFKAGTRQITGTKQFRRVGSRFANQPPDTVDIVEVEFV